MTIFVFVVDIIKRRVFISILALHFKYIKILERNALFLKLNILSLCLLRYFETIFKYT